MRARPAGVVVLSLMLLAGAAMVIAVPFSSGSAALFLLLIGGVWTTVSIYYLRLALTYRRQAQELASLARTGIRGRATILDAKLDAVAIGYDPKAELMVELDVSGASPRQAAKAMRIPQFAVPHLQERLILPAFIDPQDPSRFEIQW